MRHPATAPLPATQHAAIAAQAAVRWLAPLAPVLSLADFWPAGGARPPCVLQAGQQRLVTSGRIAIALALQAIGVKPGDKVLVPAYHSPSMVPPVLHLGAEPVFYRVGPDGAVDLADVAARLDGATRAIMVTHYFGFPQAMAAIRALCDAHGLQLLEDCAHSLFGSADGRPLGAWGDYAAASTMKFLPIYEGGCLVSARHSLDAVQLHSAGPGFEAKATLAALERSWAHGRLRAAALLLALPLRLQQALWRRKKRQLAPHQQALAPASSDSSFDFDPRWLDKRSAWFSRSVLRWSSQRRLCQRRRRHYQLLERAVTGLPGCRPLYPALPPHTVPWLFPLLVDDAETVFARLQAAGVPLVRFGQQLWQGAEHCANAARLGRHVLGLPCHQALTAAELDAIAAALRGALGGPAP